MVYVAETEELDLLLAISAMCQTRHGPGGGIQQTSSPQIVYHLAQGPLRQLLETLLQRSLSRVGIAPANSRFEAVGKAHVCVTHHPPSRGQVHFGLRVKGKGFRVNPEGTDFASRCAARAGLLPDPDFAEPDPVETHK